jgi:hypothetical protein
VRRPVLTVRQRVILADDDLSWVGWDAAGLPVVAHGPMTFAVGKKGNLVPPTTPIERMS